MRIAITAALLALAAPVAAQIKTVPVTFAKGASSATIKGTIKGDATIDYTVNAKAGQTLAVSFKPTNASAYFNVLPPGSEEAIFIGSTSGNSFKGTLPASGNTTIRVYLMRSAARRGETANYTLTVGVTGAAKAAAAGDAKVAGTNYNATAQVPCAKAASAPMAQCDAGVLRFPGGEATVQVKLPGGGMRSIYFKNGKPDSTDAGPVAMSSTRSGDLMTIKIGTERYEIPDAFVNGG